MGLDDTTLKDYQQILTDHIAKAMGIPQNTLDNNSSTVKTSIGNSTINSINGFSADTIVVDEFDQFSWKSKSEFIKEPKPKITRKHKIGSLILAEVAKAKLKDYDSAKNIDYALLGVLDFCDFIQEENLGKISDLIDKKDLVWNGITIRYNKDEQRDIFLHRKLTLGVYVDNFKYNNLINIGGNSGGKSLFTQQYLEKLKDLVKVDSKFYTKYLKNNLAKV